ncbi:MAG TPA: PilZ domain-containing protein [Polyangia bacterium]
MITVLTTNNTAIFRQLGAPAFQNRGAGLTHVVARSGAEVLSFARTRQPVLIILDVELPDGDGFSVCRSLKADPAVAKVPVIIVVTGVLTAQVLHKLVECGCDDVFYVPSPTGELYQHVAKLIGLPARRGARLKVELMAQVQGAGRAVAGQVVDLSADGAKLATDEEVARGSEIKLRLQRNGETDVLIVDGRVVWSRRTDLGAFNVGVDFARATPEQRARLAELGLWDMTVEADGTKVTLQGDFNEGTSFADLAGRLRGVVEFDLWGVRHINSTGVHRWIQFLRQLTATTAYTFVRCSVSFVTQAAMVPEVLGRGQVISFTAPYRCDTCDVDEERLLHSGALGPDHTPPEFRCTRCGMRLSFDEMPRRYFAFLGDTQPLSNPAL